MNAARNRGVFVSTSHGIVARIGPMLHVTDVNRQGRVTGLVSRATKTTPACWGVFGPGGHRAWQTCRYALTAFSDDGRRVLGEHTPGEVGQRQPLRDLPPRRQHRPRLHLPPRTRVAA